MPLFPNSDLVRGNIAHHFKKHLPVITEEALIELLSAPRSKWDAYYAVLALRDVGTTQAVPALRGMLTYPMQDVKDCAVLTIAHIAGEAETPFYVHALESKGTRKGYPMWAIEVAADERAIPSVIPFVTVALKKALRPTPGDPGDVYLMGVKYLARIGLDRSECQVLKPLFRRAWSALPAGHREVLRQHLPSDWQGSAEGAG